MPEQQRSLEGKIEELTGSPNKDKQEVEPKEGELWSRLRLGNEVQETNVGQQRKRK